jgi:hypothetical protein
MKKTLLLLLCGFSLLSQAQTDFCNKNFGESYFPMQLDFEKYLTWGSSKYKETFAETTEENGKTYYEYRQDFGNGNAPTLTLRKSNDTIYHSFKGKESIFLITTPTVGLKWNGKEIVSITGEFSTPYCVYNDLLVVKSKYANGSKDTRYYKKGLGLVGIKKGDKILGFCIPNKEETKALLRKASFKGCESDDNDASGKCTSAKVRAIVQQRLKQGGYKLPKESGVLRFKVHVSPEGKVDEVKRENSLKGGKQVAKVIQKELENLPDFNPTRTSRVKTVGTYLTFSIPIRIE